MLKKRSVLLAKLEVTYNTDSTPGVGDALLVENLSISNEGLRMHERSGPKNTMGPKSSYYGGHLRSITFDMNLKGSGTVGTAPEAGVPLQVCGFDETIVASTSVTYAPVSESISSATFYYYEDGKLRKLTGCRGNVSFNGEAGGPMKASFTITGHDAGESDASLISPTFDATVPPVFKNSAFAFDSHAAVISKLAFDMGNTIATPASVSASDGFGEIRITDRNVTGSFDPEQVLIATKDYEGFLSSDSTVALDSGVIGSVAGNKLQITQPACRATDVSFAERDGISTYEISYGAYESAGDDQVAIILT